MEEKHEIQDKEQYKKFSSGYLIKCAENKNIDEWNDLYEGYFASGWNKLHPDKEWKPENISELMSQNGIILPGYIGIDFREAIRRRVSFKGVNLEGASFWGALLMGADFREAHLEGADFREAHLEGAMFNKAHLNGAKFNEAHLKEAQFSKAHLEGTQFILATVNGDTLFTGNTIDDKTDFTGTNLSVIRIEPKLRKHLERNIRKLNITNKNVFVAMEFNHYELDSALENAIKPACLECGGLQACTVNEKAGDGWIPQRIREEIQDARFVISDLTYRNPGVYYETGYADGLDIPVIQTCKRSWYDEEPAPLHFDISQRNTIFWRDNDDLKQQIIMKIKELQENGK